MNVLVFRLKKDVISVDGIIFRKSPFGIYRADKEEYQDLNIFRGFVDAFLEAEQKAKNVEKEQENEEAFDHYLAMTLLESRIRPNDLPF